MVVALNSFAAFIDNIQKMIEFEHVIRRDGRHGVGMPHCRGRAVFSTRCDRRESHISRERRHDQHICRA